jgi:hypothetical protein
MKVDWTKLSAIAEILSAIAIVVTLAYLGLQTRYPAEQTQQSAEQTAQTNRLLSSQATYNLLQNRTAGATSIIESDEASEFWTKVRNGRILTDAESLRVESYAFRALLNWQWEYGEYQPGNIDEADLPIDTWVRSYAGRDTLRRIDIYPDVYARMRNVLNPGLVDFMDSNVVQWPL